MKVLLKIYLCMALLGLTLIAHAEENTKAGCKADKEKFCQGIEAGRGRIARCLKDHESQLSSECKTAIQGMREQVRQKIATGKENCKADMEKFCQGVEPGQGRLIRCLKEHEAQLAPDCQASLPKRSFRQQQK